MIGVKPLRTPLASLRIRPQTERVNHAQRSTSRLPRDYGGIEWLLEHGADPNRMTPWGFTALHQAVRRDNALEILELLLDHRADPTLLTCKSASSQADSKSAIAIAARRGRGDALELFERRGFPIALHGIERLVAACARNDSAGARAIAVGEPNLLCELLAEGGKLLAEFSGNGNTEGVRLLLDLGVNAGALFVEADGYWGVAKNSTALHVAAWRARHSTVAFLLERGAPFDAQDGAGRTPLALAVRACVDSFWTERRSPESVHTLLRAGASLHGVPFPSGYPVVDELLKAHGAKE